MIRSKSIKFVLLSACAGFAVCGVVLTANHLRPSRLPPDVERFLSGVESRMERISVIWRAVETSSDRPGLYWGRHVVFVKEGDQYFSDVTFGATDEKSLLWDAGRSGGISYVRSREAFFHNSEQLRHCFDEAPYLVEHITTENLIISRLADLPNRRILGETIREKPGVYSIDTDLHGADPLKTVGYFFLLGTTCGGHTDWGRALREGTITALREGPEPGLVTLEGQWRVLRYELELDRMHDCLLRGFRVFYAGKLVSEARVTRYLEVDGRPYPAAGVCRLVQSATLFQTYDIEVLDLALEPPTSVRFEPGMVFPDGARGEDKRTGRDFTFDKSTGRFKYRKSLVVHRLQQFGLKLIKLIP